MTTPLPVRPALLFASTLVLVGVFCRLDCTSVSARNTRSDCAPRLTGWRAGPGAVGTEKKSVSFSSDLDTLEATEVQHEDDLPTSSLDPHFEEASTHDSDSMTFSQQVTPLPAGH